eukprot:TRINITY_DN111975_c0_g1_i1.p1 TRINITY_DN111975_c0_g1~~TRINITY_DN111975_c0_g1_i1.p1  ORF type:complete len:291 (-),score=58.65 TRINITY_DN111975_c0_g1_i1:142-1014(-)
MASLAMSKSTSPQDLKAIIWQSIAFQDTYVGRDKSARLFQYLFRMLGGLTNGNPICGGFCTHLSLSRKTLRFWKPVKAIKRIEDTDADTNLDSLEKKLTTFEIASEAVYCCLDHVIFFQRCGFFKWASAEVVDRFERFAELFWLTEILPVIIREVRTLKKLQQQEKQALAGLETDMKLNQDINVNTDVPKMKSNEMIERELIKTGTKIPKSLSVTDIRAAQRKVLLILFKYACCDLPCSLYFLKPAAWRNKNHNKVWCGLLGVFSSLVSLYQNWPKQQMLQKSITAATPK